MKVHLSPVCFGGSLGNLSFLAMSYGGILGGIHWNLSAVRLGKASRRGQQMELLVVLFSFPCLTGRFMGKSLIMVNTEADLNNRSYLSTSDLLKIMTILIVLCPCCPGLQEPA
jgi:hypothetical protein